ncbi:MAG TPA: pyridoxal-phosphate dependent enzyme, partial [bacterium]|nr:pyridoxal-phosphate dependent enzyme [bacterium]
MSVVRFPKRVPLSIVPTQIHHLPRLTRLLGGPEIFMKRDDLTGCAMTGNKVRKLEFLCAEAIRRGATTLMTCGGVQSNHARTTAVAAARLGMKSILFLRGQCPQTTQGNLLL